MDLARYVEELQHGLLVAAEAGGEEATQLAGRLVAPLRSSMHLVLLDALASAAAEITSELAPGAVEVRMRGRDPEFVVTTPLDDAEVDAITAAQGAAAPPPAGGPTADGDDDASTARITLRLPDALKVRVEEAAGRDGLSVNAWLVRTLSSALGERPASAGPRPPSSGQRFTGWSRA